MDGGGGVGRRLGEREDSREGELEFVCKIKKKDFLKRVFVAFIEHILAAHNLL